jgi:magnesium transporter
MLGTLVRPNLNELVRDKDWDTIREVFSEWEAPDCAEALERCEPQVAALVFRILPRDTAGETFEYLPLEMQTELVTTLGDEQLKAVLDEMAPDDRTRLLEELPGEVTRRLIATLSPEQRKIASALLGYPERTAGRSMTPEYVTLRPEMTVSEALAHIRDKAPGSETINTLYVVDPKGRLLDDVRLSSLVLASPEALVKDLDDRQLISIPATATNEEVVASFEKYDRVALPVTDSRGFLLGIITIDDVLDVQADEATEDIQKLGGSEALDAPYLDVGFGEMLRKRAVWLAVLFFGEMLTASAMQHYEHQIERAVVLALFVPLIISSGGNTGSQATSIIIRALALREVQLSDWWRVLRSELAMGVTLGAILGTIGFLRILFWPSHAALYGPHYVRIGLTVALSLLGVVLFGTVTGSMLPFILRRLRLDPASASAPFVATLVDVTGLVIYFSVANVLLKGVLL